MDRASHIGDGRELLIGEVYKAMLGAVPLSSALKELALLTQSDKALWACHDRHKRTSRITDHFNFDRQFLESYHALYGSHDIWLEKPQYFQAEGLIWRGSRIAATADMVKTSFYQKLLKPHQIHHTLHIVVMVGTDYFFRVLLTRRPYEPDYSEADIELARCFALHARRAADSLRLTAQLRMVQHGLSGVIDDAGLGVAIVDPPAVIYASETCEQLLASLGAPTATNVVEMSKGEDARAPHFHFPRKVAAAINSHDFQSTTRLVIERPGTGRLLVDIRPFQFRGLSALDRRIGLIVTFLDLDHRAPIDDELLRDLYALTPSEARVCALLATGGSVEDVSEKLNISPNTARTHIKRIFGKTGSTRQSELVRLVMSAARLHSSRRKSAHEHHAMKRHGDRVDLAANLAADALIARQAQHEM